MNDDLMLRAIGVVRSPFVEKMEAPRQARPGAEDAALGTVEIFARGGFEHALEGLDAWSHIWLVAFLDRAGNFRPKVQPPRSDRRRGVFATRSPHRPNPIGLSAVELIRVEGLRLFVRGIDLLDHTPILDVKPYVAYTDAIPDASSGWLEKPSDPIPAWTTAWSPLAKEQLLWLIARGVDLEAAVTRVLALGPQPNAYRRIRRENDASVLAFKAWRVRFRTIAERSIEVVRIDSGYRPREIALGAGSLDLELHGEFGRVFGRR